MKHIKFILILVIVLILWNCNKNKISGNTSETTNTISGVVNSDSSKTENTIINLYPINYDPTDSSLSASVLSTSADSAGNFLFEEVDPGIYNLIAELSDKKALVSNINVTGPEQSIEINPILEETGTLTLNSQQLPGLNGILFIPGTNIFIEVDSAGADSGIVVLLHLPEGEYPELKFISSGDTVGTNVLEDTLVVHQKDSLVVFHDTTDTGVKDTILIPPKPLVWEITWSTNESLLTINKPLANFPLLVRFTPGNFSDFDSIISKEKIWFTDSKKIRRPHHIERWDSLTGKAELWVLVDSIFPNKSDYIHMNWVQYGGPRPQSQNVFDTSYGFAGVWHMNDVSGQSFDQTQNSNHGNFEGDMPGPTEGIIGQGQKFDGLGDFIKIPHHPSLNINEYTLSAWIKTNEYSGRIFDKTTAAVADGLLFHIWEGELRACMDMADCLKSDSIPLDAYTHVAISHATDNITFFIDGKITHEFDTLLTSFSNNFDLRIGAEKAEGINSATWFNGIIDEARISKRVRTSDWINWSYQNQRKESSLLNIQRR